MAAIEKLDQAAALVLEFYSKLDKACQNRRTSCLFILDHIDSHMRARLRHQQQYGCPMPMDMVLKQCLCFSEQAFGAAQRYITRAEAAALIPAALKTPENAALLHDAGACGLAALCGYSPSVDPTPGRVSVRATGGKTLFFKHQ